MRRFVPLLTFCCALLSCNGPDKGTGVTVEEARITLPAVRSRPGAAYFSIKSRVPARLIGITSERIQRIELHESTAGGMGPLRDTAIPADRALEFAPGGKHAMLFGVDPALKIGGRAPLVFSFDGAPNVTVQAEVLAPGGGHASH